jgi:stress response protein SCP2
VWASPTKILTQNLFIFQIFFVHVGAKFVRLRTVFARIGTRANTVRPYNRENLNLKFIYFSNIFCFFTFGRNLNKRVPPPPTAGEVPKTLKLRIPAVVKSKTVQEKAVEIQELINASASVTIPSGEYEGPFLITRAANVSSKDGSVLLYVREPGTAALNISVAGVSLSGISLQSSSPSEPALLMLPDTVTENVSVYGTVIGNPREEGFFDIPYSLFAGEVKAGEAFELTVKISLPVPAGIEAQRGVSVSQTSLPAGVSTLGIRLPSARDGAILRCSVYVKTAVVREMVFTAAVSENAKPLGYAPLLFEPESEGNTKSNAFAAAKAEASPIKTDSKTHKEPQKVVATPAKKAGEGGTPTADRNVLQGQSGITYILPKTTGGGIRLSRGMHYPLSTDSSLEIELLSDNNADVDAYVFLHDGTMKIKDSRNLVFFGNDTGASGAIRYINTSAKRLVRAELSRIPDVFSELDFIYASYDEGVVTGNLLIKGGGETLVIPLSGDAQALTAFEITRSQGGFTLTPLVMPYRRGIRELIRSYGLSVT